LRGLPVKNNNRVDNYIPFQVDNTHPVEIVIHLFKEIDEFEANDSPNDSIRIVNGINDEHNDEQSRNLTVFIKKSIEKNNLTINRRASLTTSPSPKTAKVEENFDYKALATTTTTPTTANDKHCKTNNSDVMADQNSELSVDIVSIGNTNQFYLHLTDWEAEFEKICQCMEKEYNIQNASGETTGNNSSCLPDLTLNITPVITKLNEKDIKKGVICAYINREKSIYRRALVVDIPKKKSSKQALYVDIFLFDLGKYFQACVDNLYVLHDKYFEMAPLCFECTLGLPKLQLELDEQLSTQFKTLVQLNKNFKIKIIKKMKPIDVVDSQYEISRFHVNLYGTRADKRETPFEYVINFGEELKLFGSALSTSSVNKLNVLSVPVCEKINPFNETDMPLNQTFKIQLTNLDTVKNFGVILRSQLESRDAFLKRFHEFHRSNRTSLKPLFENSNLAASSNSGTKNSMKNFIGMPCALSSVQISRWCRGLIVNLDVVGKLANIYLVDYGNLMAS
jgi:hypothetical protein